MKSVFKKRKKPKLFGSFSIKFESLCHRQRNITTTKYKEILINIGELRYCAFLDFSVKKSTWIRFDQLWGF